MWDDLNSVMLDTYGTQATLDGGATITGVFERETPVETNGVIGYALQFSGVHADFVAAGVSEETVLTIGSVGYTVAVINPPDVSGWTDMILSLQSDV